MDFSNQVIGCIDMHSLEIGRFPAQLTGMAAFLFKQNVRAAANHILVEATLLRFDKRLQPRQPLALQSIIDLIRKISAGRAGPLRILEELAVREPDFGDKVERRFEVRIRLARETDDKIG